MIDFSAAKSSDFPGYGIRSLAELQIPIMAYQKAVGAVYTNIAERDDIWGRMYNALTVRSDTFVVYGYLEAVRQNPRYTGPFDNSTVWYQTATGPGGAVTVLDPRFSKVRVVAERTLPR